MHGKVKQSNNLNRSGFTLIELLVVVTIICLLAAILLPVFARARENARRASCMSNMKQLALAMLMYAQDNDGGLPSWYNNGSGGGGYNILYVAANEYIHSTQVLRCPSAPALKNPAAYASSGYGSTYGFSEYAVNSGSIYWVAMSGTPQKLDNCPYPARTCLLGETQYAYSNYYEDRGWGWSSFAPGNAGNLLTTSANWLNGTRHLGGSNYAFVDGHVKWLNASVVKAVGKAGNCLIMSQNNFPIGFCVGE